MDTSVIQIIEDEEDITELLKYNLAKQGFNVRNSFTGKEGMDMLSSKPTDLLLLDLMLPDMNGMDLCRRVKADPKLKDLPIIILTAKGEEEDIVKGLNEGADDYITKPFSPRVLTARVNTVLKRVKRDRKDKQKSIIEFPFLRIDPGRHQVWAKGTPIELSRTEFQILHLIATRAGWVFTRSQIVSAINGENHAVTDRSVDVQVVGIRKKLGDLGHYVETVRGVGYRFKDFDFDA